MNKKYQLTNHTKEVKGRNGRIHILHQIQALQDFTSETGHEVHAGDYGGWIEREANLSQNGGAWVNYFAKVYGGAEVYGDAFIDNASEVFDQAKVGDTVRLLDVTKVYGNSVLVGHTTAYGINHVGGKSFIQNCDLIAARLVNVTVSGNWARVTDSFVKDVTIRDDGRIIYSTVIGVRNSSGVNQLMVEDSAIVCNSTLEGRFTLSDNARIENCNLKCFDWRHPCKLSGAMGVKSYASDNFHSPIKAPDELYPPVLRELLANDELYSDQGLVAYDREAKLYFVRGKKFMTEKEFIGWSYRHDDKHPGLVESVQSLITHFKNHGGK